jgi:polygalacturonase
MSDFSVDDEGAIGDGTALDTYSIQASIDRASQAGGGRVVLSSGKTYSAGSIVLKSNVELHIPAGAILRASPNFADYTVVQRGVVQMDEPKSDHSSAPTASFLFADFAENIAITGSGTIDGNGRSYVTEPGVQIHVTNDHRAFTIHLRNINRVAIRDIQIVDGALWTLRLSRCDDVVIHAITINNDVRMPNSDGIDIDTCRRVRISDCDIQSGDDAICLKAAIESTRDGRVCENVVITGCTLRSSSTAVLCGVECDTAIQDVIVTACVIYSSNRGLAVSLHERGTIRRVRFENIILNTDLFDERWWGRGEPIYVVAAPRSTRVGSISQITFRGITARSPRGIFIYSAVDGAVKDIQIDDVDLELFQPVGLSTIDANYADIRPTTAEGIFPDPVVAARIHGANNVTVDRLRIRAKGAGAETPDVLKVTNSEDLTLRNIKIGAE